jgi:hypothetical protein
MCEFESLTALYKNVSVDRGLYAAKSLNDYLLFYIPPIKNLSLIWRRHHCLWKAANFGPMLGAQGIWAGRDLYRATPAVTWGLGFVIAFWIMITFCTLLASLICIFSGLIQRITIGRWPESIPQEDWMTIYCFTSRSRFFFYDMETSPLPVKGCTM